MNRKTIFENVEQWSLGDLIERIEKIGLKRDNGEDKTVCFDFGTAIPTDLFSWRGSYDQLALGYELTGYDNDVRHMAEITAEELLNKLKSAVGQTFTGWKGGEYTMDETTAMWVANPGNSGETAIVGVKDDGWRMIIITAHCEY